MASAAEFSIFDVFHVYIVGSGAHLESDFSVANIAFEANAMIPVRKDHRTHSGFFRSLVEYYVTVFREDSRWKEQRERGQQHRIYRQTAEYWLLVSKMVFHSICLD
jgi:hypothetical protein